MRYIFSVRPLAPGVGRRLYMALVRPGATDPGGRGSAPYAGRGVRNDIVYDEAAVSSGHSVAWSRLLLDHEYFHARHMAGATLLPVVHDEAPEVERHYNEAAAWGFNVAEARAGRYPGLRADEFREALDRLGEHYATLRALLKDADPERWSRIAELLRRPETLLTPAGAPPAAGVRLSAASDRERPVPRRPPCAGNHASPLPRRWPRRPLPSRERPPARAGPIGARRTVEGCRAPGSHDAP